MTPKAILALLALCLAGCAERPDPLLARMAAIEAGQLQLRMAVDGMADTLKGIAEDASGGRFATIAARQDMETLGARIYQLEQATQATHAEIMNVRNALRR